MVCEEDDNTGVNTFMRSKMVYEQKIVQELTNI